MHLASFTLACAGPIEVKSSEVNPLVSADIYVYAGQLVAVEPGRRLNLLCMGEGSPAVVFEAGGWDGLLAWRKVQGAVSSFTQACSYDRAGLGFSDPATHPSNARNNVDDLKRLVTAGKIKLPMVLVGHSAGGLYATVYASQHPADVVGMVLVDPSFAQQDADFNRIRSPQQRVQEDQEIAQILSGVKRCVEMAHAGTLTASTMDPPICLRKTDDPTLTAELTRQLVRPQTQEAMLSEGESMSVHVRDDYSVNLLQAEAAIKNLGNMPLIVMTRGSPRKSPATSIELFNGIEAAWKAGHDRLAALSTRGKSIVVPGAGHQIQLERPDAVIDAIREVVMTVRADAGNVKPPDASP